MKLWAYECSAGGRVTDILDWTDNDVFVSRTRKNLSLPADFVARHSGSFIMSADGEADIPPPRFHSLKALAKSMFQITKEANGTYTIRNVPLYKAHPDMRKYGIQCDRSFLDRMVKNFYATRIATKELFGTTRFSWLPKIHWGHTPDNGDVEEREAAGFIDNLYRVEDFLIGDFVGLDKATLDKLVNGKYPDRSAEVDLKRARLLSVAVLGFRTPHFALPQMTPQELREQYLAVVQKNKSEVEGIESFVLLKEDLNMPQANTKKAKHTRQVELTPDLIVKFFMRCQTDDEFNSQFEALKEEAISKHCGMNGGMYPQGADLMAIIQQVMQQMMSQRMNGSPVGGMGQGQGQNGTQMNASDFLDFESRTHHEHEGEGDLDEEGTDVDDPKHPGDADVKNDGQPDVEGVNYETISEGGDVISKSALQVVKRAKNSVAKIRDPHVREQIGAVVDELGSALVSQSELVKRSHEAVVKAAKEIQIQKNARRKQEFETRLIRMFEAGNPNVVSKEKIAKHLKILMDMNDAKAQEYLSVLEDVPAIKQSRHVTKGELIDPEHSEDRISRAKNILQKDRGLRRAGATPAHLAAIDLIDELTGNLE